jgi:hypothetical protein
MTSANSINYIVKDSTGKEVTLLHRNNLCKENWTVLLGFFPYHEFTITPMGYDEDEDEWFGQTTTLKEFLIRKKLI